MASRRLLHADAPALPRMIRLEPRLAHKPWGREDLRPWFGDGAMHDRVGEIIYPPVSRDGLLAKYLFTSEALSVQVHPDDATARRHGHDGGKEEAWLILDAKPGARIGLGLVAPVSPETLAAAARDGSIEDLLGWREAKAGDTLRIPPGTIHAIGAGLTLVEIQENRDITYRLYDYGRPRPLHLDQAVEAATAGPYVEDPAGPHRAKGWQRIIDGDAFTVDHLRGAGEGRIDGDGPVTLVPLGADARLNGVTAPVGTVWELAGPADFSLSGDASLLLACPKAAGEARFGWKAE